MSIDRIRTIKLRPIIFTVHSWIGLVVGIFLAIIGLTGSGIVFMHELDHTLNPALMHVEAQGQPQSLASLPEVIDLNLAPVIRWRSLSNGESYPNLAIDSIQLPKTSSDPVLVSMKTAQGERQEIYINPYTSKILGERIWEKSIVGFMHTLHYTLFAGNAGQIAVGVEGGLFSIVSLTGIQTADMALPEGKISLVSFAPDGKTISLRKKLPEQQTGMFDLSTVEIDRATSKVISATKVIEPPPMFKVILTIVDLHYGTWGGLATQILYVIIGFVPTLLMVTGFLLWKRKGKVELS